MFLDEKALEYWWKNKKTAFDKKKELVDRFDEIGEIVELFQKITPNLAHLNAFRANNTGDTSGSGKSSLDKMKHADLLCAEDMWKLIGGWDGNKFDERFRIISSSRGSKENYFENEDYSVIHNSLWANSNFASNNYPSQIAKFIQECNKVFDTAIETSKMVLTWESDSYLKKDQNGDYFPASKERLETRFPPKFLWMWANKDKVLHPFSLMAFRNFLTSKFMADLLNKEEIAKILDLKEKDCADDFKKFPKLLTDMKFDCFTKVWKHISDAIRAKLNPPLNIADLPDLSKLISILMVEETDMKNVSELLCTSKQIILYGALGTGKTYTAQQVVKEFVIKCENATEQLENEDKTSDSDIKLEDYRFSKKCPLENSLTQTTLFKKTVKKRW